MKTFNVNKCIHIHLLHIVINMEDTFMLNTQYALIQQSLEIQFKNRVGDSDGFKNVYKRMSH